MKRYLILFLIGCLCLSFAGCKVLDYKEATDYYNAGQYAEALEIYSSLGDYADSAAMAQLSWQKADYESAEAHYAAGEYRQALELYTGLEMYMDSPAKAVSCHYAVGLELLQNGSYGEAITWLAQLGSYEDCPERIQEARLLWLDETLTELGGLTVDLAGNGQQTLSLVSTGGDTLHLIYASKSQLLGVPNESRFAMILYPQTQTAAYEASYRSSSSSTILEEASGTVDLQAFNAGQGLDTYFFTQTITGPDGTVTVSQQTTDAIMLQGLLQEACAIIAEQLPAMLESTGVDITAAQLGFSSLA